MVACIRTRTSRVKVFAVVDLERAHQQAKWGDDDTTSLAEYVLYMEDYLTEARKILTRQGALAGRVDALHAMRKITALGVASMEAHGVVPRDDARKDPQYCEKANS